MKYIFSLGLFCLAFLACKDPENNEIRSQSGILGFDILTDISAHWIGTNETPFGDYDWFSFDFRPISSSHTHAIYEGGTNQNIIVSLFLAELDGDPVIMARNGGWLGNQYRATYFILDKAEHQGQQRYYRLVDAVGGVKRAYMEFVFDNDQLHFDAYKDNSGTLDDPIHHMGFVGIKKNEQLANTAASLFNFPQEKIEHNFGSGFQGLVDPNSALYLAEDQDPFPESEHKHVSTLKSLFNKDASIADDPMLLFLSIEPIVDDMGQVHLSALQDKTLRTTDITPSEYSFTHTYLHPGTYFTTVFSDRDGNSIPSSGDISNYSIEMTIDPEKELEINIDVNREIP